MKEKQMLEIVSYYLPYDLKIRYYGITNGKELGVWEKQNKDLNFLYQQEFPKPEEIYDWKTGKIKKIETYLKYWKFRVGNGHKSIFNNDFGSTAFLILRPISYLNTHITHNDNKFVPIYQLQMIDKSFCLSDIETYGYENLKVSVYEKLLEWHFDIFGLIEKRLAIDMNDL